VILGAVDSRGRRGLIFRFSEPMINESHSKYRHLISELPNFRIDAEKEIFQAQYFLNLGGTHDTAVLCSFIDSISIKISELKAFNQSSFFEIFNQVMDEWADLLQYINPEAIDLSKIIGLFGELLVLESLTNSKKGVISNWYGPEGDRFDFRLAAFDIEVKSSTSTDAKKIHVHGIDQLEKTARPGYLAFVQLELLPGGRTVSNLVSSIAYNLPITEKDLFFKKLGRLGFDFKNSQLWDQVSFNFFKCSLYLLDSNFPLITLDNFVEKSLPLGTSQFQYVIDLQALPVLESTGNLEKMNWSLNE
jgi:hypothetical protein